jgi:hypothetical protein
VRRGEWLVESLDRGADDHGAENDAEATREVE